MRKHEPKHEGNIEIGRQFIKWLANIPSQCHHCESQRMPVQLSAFGEDLRDTTHPGSESGCQRDKWQHLSNICRFVNAVVSMLISWF